MKLISTLIFVLFLLSSLLYSLPQAEFYISLTGNDNNPGTISSPFKTIERARDTIRQINASMTGDIIVHIREGRYEVDATIQFDKRDGGTNSYKVVYQAYSSETVRISGGNIITGWSQVNDSIYKANVTGQRFRQLYVNGKRGIRARKPNRGASLREGSYDSFIWDLANNNIKVHNKLALGWESWSNLDEVELVIQRIWTSANLRIAAIAPAGYNLWDITPREPERYNVFESTAIAQDFNGMWCFAENCFEFLDTIGEFYHNTSTGDLFYYPEPGQDMATATVIIPTIDTLINIEGTTDSILKNMDFNYLIFEHSNWLYPSDSGYVGRQGPLQYPILHDRRMNSAVRLRHVNNINFTRNVFQHCGGIGLDYYEDAKDISIEGNVFYDIAGQGLMVDQSCRTSQTGFDTTGVLCKNVRIANNYCERMGQDYYSCSAIWGGSVNNLVIEHNEVTHCPYIGIRISWWAKTDSILARDTIRYNRVHNTNRFVSDGSPIYVNGINKDAHVFENYNYDIDRFDLAIGHPVGIFHVDDNATNYTFENNVWDNRASDVIIWAGVRKDAAQYNTFINNGTSDQGIRDRAGLESAYLDIKNWDDSRHYDITPPTIASVTTEDSTNLVTIIYSETVDSASAVNISNYSINNSITINSVTLNNSKTVILNTSTLSTGITYTVTVNNIKDKAASQNTITPNTQIYFVYPGSTAREDQANLLDDVNVSVFPNPFNPIISLRLIRKEDKENGKGKGKENISLKIFDIKGRLVKDLSQSLLPSSVFLFSWNASNLPSGIYTLRATIGNKTFNKKIVLMK